MLHKTLAESFIIALTCITRAIRKENKVVLDQQREVEDEASQGEEDGREG